MKTPPPLPAALLPPRASPYTAFWMGGFEGADHCNGSGRPLDMARSSGHLDHLDGDYRRAAALGIRCVRESIGWRLAEPSTGCFDFERVQRIQASARRHGVQVLWTLMHYGTPPDVSLHDDALIDRFARYAVAAARALQAGAPDAPPPVYNMINEMGFLAWAACETDMLWPYRRATRRRRAPSTLANGYGVKQRLVRAVLAAIDAVRAVQPQARFLHIEPLVHVVAPRHRPELQQRAEAVCNYQWQAWDMLAGRADPALGGSEAALDLIGVNCYHSGQWEVGTERRLWWHKRDPRRRPFGDQLLQTWQRYGRELIVAETSHVGVGRAEWLDDIAGEVQRARGLGVPVSGICLYPLVDRPDWDDAAHWHHSGLWDVEPAIDPAVPPQDGAGVLPLQRRLCAPYAACLATWQQRLPGDAVAPPAAVVPSAADLDAAVL